MGLRPFHDTAEFLPITHFLIGQVFDRCPRDDEAVKVAMFHLIKKDIEIRDMTLTCVRRLVGTGHQKGAVHLERRVGERAEQLELRVFLERHQIQNQDLQRSYVLRHCAFLIHHKDVFLFQDGFRRQIVLNAYGHRYTSCSLLCL